MLYGNSTWKDWLATFLNWYNSYPCCNLVSAVATRQSGIGHENIKNIFPYIMLMHGFKITHDFGAWSLCFIDQLTSKFLLFLTSLLIIIYLLRPCSWLVAFHFSCNLRLTRRSLRGQLHVNVHALFFRFEITLFW